MYNATMKRIWFKRKRYGWGWYPCTWQGVGLIVLYVAILFLMARRQQAGPGHDAQVTGFLVRTAVMTVILLVITYLTGEKPRWQWGGDREDPKEK